MPIPIIPNSKVFLKEMPSPSVVEIDTELFQNIFQVIKDWDIRVPEYYDGWSSGNGSHVKLLLDVIKPALRGDKLNDLGI